MSVASGFVVVAIGGALGACTRYAITLLFQNTSSGFPYATLVANLTGALLAGVLVSVFMSRALVGNPLQLLLVTGFLGSFTTLSAFSVETLKLFQSGAVLPAITNVLVTVIGALGAVSVGFWVGHSLTR